MLKSLTRNYCLVINYFIKNKNPLQKHLTLLQICASFFYFNKTIFMNLEKIINFLDQDFNLVIGKVLGLIASQFSKNTAKNTKQN